MYDNFSFDNLITINSISWLAWLSSIMIGGAFLVKAKSLSGKRLDNIVSIICAIVLVLSIVTNFVTKKSAYNMIETDANGGYVIYIDGTKTDADKIVFKNYPLEKIKINDEQKTIKISTAD